MPSRRHADFSWRRQYRCADCQEVLTTGTSLIKRNFGAVADECTHLFKYIKNVRLGEEITRRFTDWLHVVNDVHCIGCDAQVGWKVVSRHWPGVVRRRPCYRNHASHTPHACS